MEGNTKEMRCFNGNAPLRIFVFIDNLVLIENSEDDMKQCLFTFSLLAKFGLQISTAKQMICF